MRHRLKTECDPVPCPKCGCYQEDMVDKLCREYRIWLYWSGVVAIFVGVLCGASGFLTFEFERRAVALALYFAAFLAIVGGIAAICWRRQMADQFEPNMTPVEERLAIADERAVKVKNFEKWLKEQGVDLEKPETI